MFVQHRDKVKRLLPVLMEKTFSSTQNITSWKELNKNLPYRERGEETSTSTMSTVVAAATTVQHWDDMYNTRSDA